MLQEGKNDNAASSCYRCQAKMAKKYAFRLTGRDNAILEAIDRFPLTADQLCRISVTFEHPFSDVHSVRRRLRKLAAAGLVQARPYAVASYGSSPAYYKLTRDGYRMQYGHDAELPKRRYFDPIGQARHPHTRKLADFLVHVFSVAHDAGYRIQHFARENSVVLETASGELRPDAAFQVIAGNRALNFLVELDNGTERVQSKRDTESIERKIRGYYSHSRAMKAFDRDRYVVLFVTTRSAVRLKHMMAHASAITSNSQRTLFLGTTLDDFLTRKDALSAKCFLSPDFKSTAMIPQSSRGTDRTKVEPNLISTFPAFC